MKLVKDMASTFITTILVFIISILTSVIIARNLGPNGQGIYSLILLFPTLIVSFTQFGIGRSIIYHISKGEIPIKNIIGNILFITVLIITIALSSGFVIFFWFNNLFFHDIPKEFLLLGLIIIPFQICFLQISSGIFYGIQKIRIYNLANTIQPLIIFILVYISIYILNIGILGVIAANLISLIFATAFTFFFIFRVLKLPLTISFDKRIFKSLFSFGIKVHIGNFMYFLRSRLDVFLLNYFLNPSAVGFYSISFGTAETLWTLSSSISNVLSPRITSMKNDTDKKELTPLIARNVLLLTIIGALIIYLLSNYLILLLYSINYYESIQPLQILLIGVVAVSLERILTADIIARGKPMITNYILFVTVMSNLILNIILIRYIGIQGAAWASSISYTANLYMTLYTYCKISGNSVRNVVLVKKSDIYLYLTILKSVKQKLSKSNIKY